MTDATLTFIIVAGIVFFLAGLLFGFLIKSAIGGKAGSSQPEAAEGQEILRLATSGKGELLVQMGGQSFQAYQNLTSGQQDRLLRITELLRKWQGLSAPPAAAAEAAPAGDQAAGAALPASAPADTQPRPAFNPAQTASIQKRGLSGPVELLSRALQTDVRKPETSTSIAAQVDEILQKKLESLNMKDRAIRLMELPGKGMVVLIGLNQYNDVSAVPDPEIQQLIRACVKEWEQKS